MLPVSLGVIVGDIVGVALALPVALGVPLLETVEVDVALAEGTQRGYVGGATAKSEHDTLRTRVPSATKMTPLVECTRTAEGEKKAAAAPKPSAHAELPLPAIVDTMPVASDIARR